jgi:nucleoid DNA-binding protein
MMIWLKTSMEFNKGKSMATRQQSGMGEVVERVQATLGLSTNKEAEALVRVFESCLEETLSEHLAEDGYSIKLGGFGRFVVHHHPPIRRKIGFSRGIRDLTAAYMHSRIISWSWARLVSLLI